MPDKERNYEPKIKEINSHIVRIGEHFRYVYIYSGWNCKLKTFENLNTFCSLPEESQKKYANAIKEELDNKSLFVHSVNFSHIETFKKYFNMAYCVEVPIGYSGGQQYHALFYSENFNYKNRIKKEECKWT